MKALLIAFVVLIGVAAILYSGDRPEAHIYQAFRGPCCEVCGSTNNLEWAHAYPYNMSTGTLEYLKVEQTNGVTLCRKDHERIGHYGNFSKYWNKNLIPCVKLLRESKEEYK